MNLRSTRASFNEFKDRLLDSWQLSTVVTLPKISGKKTAGDSLEDILRQLVAIPTVSGNFEANHHALEYIAEFLRQRHMHVLHIKHNGVESLIATSKKGQRRPKVMLNAHLDVVPADPELFELREEEGKYYGRGVFDMKFAIAAYMSMVDELKHDLDKHDFGIMINTDEEIGGMDGAARLAEDGFLGEMMIIPDGGDNWNIETKARGAWGFTIKTKGTSAHGSRPWEGDSANDKLLKVIHEIQALFAGQNSKTNTLNVGVIRGGKAANQVAARASASLDVRTLNKQDEQKLHRKIERICQKNSVELTTDIYAPPCFTDVKNPHIAAFIKSTEKIVGRKIGQTESYGASDARHFISRGVPCALMRPPGGNPHGPQEWIDKQGFRDLKSILIDFVTTHAKAS